MRWISLRKEEQAPDCAHISVKLNWPSRLELYREPVVQQFVEWLLSDDDDEEEEEEEDDDEEEEDHA